MITRERLLEGLNELTYVEEGMISMFANFAKTLVLHTEEISEEKKKDITKLLSLLQRDSTRHKDLVDKMIIKVEKSGKNEY